MNKKKLLLAVDESEGAGRALGYVAEMVGAVEGVQLTLLNVISIPEEDFFPSAETRKHWITKKQSEAQQMLEIFSTSLIDHGLSRENIALNIVTTETSSVADVIMEVQEDIGAGTVIVARRGIPREEEFLLGSTSNRLLHSLRNCAIWVIE